MQYADFCWRGRLASEMGVTVTEQVSYIRPEEVVNTVQVPGRSGTLRLRGQAAYGEVAYSPVCILRPGADREAVFAWLRGSGQVVFGSMPDAAFDARLSGQIAYAELVDGAPDGYLTFTPGFICQPYRYQAAPDADIVIDGGQDAPVMIRNPGNVDAAPIITVRGSGDMTLTISGSAVVLSGLVDGIVLDCEMLDAYSLDRSALLNNRMDGDFPVIPPGDCYVAWALGEGAALHSVTITPMWRWI